MRKHKTGIIAILLLAGLLLLGGCFPSIQPSSDKTPFQIAQEQVQKIMDAYIYIYDKTMALANDPNITESEKKVVAANTAILKEVWPSLIACLVAISNNKIPSQIDLEAADDILDLIEGATQ